MDLDSEVRRAILALVRAHIRLTAEYRALYRTIRAASTETPHLKSLLRGVLNNQQGELERAEQEAAEVEKALSSNEEFADLLQRYAGPDLEN
jgi:hypothetical protein